MDVFFDYVDFYEIFSAEKKKGEGEDAGFSFYENKGQAVCAAVFDGCGGLGARHYAKYGNHTGAYIAARLAKEEFQNFFEETSRFGKRRNALELKDRVYRKLKDAEEKYGEISQIVGSMSKKLPTTAAAAICDSRDPDGIELYWAGDSRVYLLNSYGLAQLTEDDIDGMDAMENLSEDGTLTNVINVSTDFEIHSQNIRLQEPSILLAATDGCFGYYSTPMEFEDLLLRTMQEAGSISQWFKKLRNEINLVAGDDYTISAFAVGFGRQAGMKNVDLFTEYIVPAFRKRREWLYAEYIEGLETRSRKEKKMLWDRYKKQYNRFLSGNGLE